MLFDILQLPRPPLGPSDAVPRTDVGYRLGMAYTPTHASPIPERYDQLRRAVH